MEIHEVNLINHVSLDSCCRTCMNESENMRSLLYDNNDAGRSLSDVLSFVASIQVKENDKLPKQICERCVSNAQAACSFKELCQKTESTLKEAIRRDIFRKDIGGGSEMRREISLQAHMSMADDFDEPLVKNEFEVDEVKLNGDFFPYNVSCHICFKMFKTKQELQKHTENLHSCFQCSECGVKYTSESDLVKHLYADHNFSEVKPVVKLDVDSKIISDPIKCDNCNEIFATRKTFNSHRKRCKKHKTLKRSKRIKKEIVVESDDSLSDSPLHNLIRSPKDGSEFDSNDFKSESMSSLDQDDSELVEQEPQSNNLSLCLSCGLTFKSERAYKIHAGRKHGIGRRTKSVKRKANLSGASEFKCFCLQKFNSLHELQVHTCDKTDLDLSKPPDPFPCTMCERKFLKKSSLDSHLKRHEMQANEVHTCSICKREFKRKAHLNNHMLTHSADHGFKCDSCSKTFASQESLDVHLATHKGSKKHQCSFCDKGFNMLSTLKDHIRTHTGEKPFLCSICGRGFSQGTNLKEHLRRHQGLKLFKCPQCTHTFVSKGELEAHLRKHSGAHPFVCDVCGSGFTTSSSLVKHKRIHTGERPYSCEFCSMSFTALGTLKNHRRTHTGEKPYKCTFCVKAFVQKNDLVSHTRTHTGERPYVCTTCGHAFRQSSALKSHLKMHLGISERSTMRQNDVAFTLTRGESTLSMSPVEALITMRPGETILTLRPADDSPMDTAPSDTVSLQQEGDVASDSIITVLPLCKTSPVEIA